MSSSGFMVTRKIRARLHPRADIRRPHRYRGAVIRLRHYLGGAVLKRRP